jgi:hypothetical protein
VCGISVTENTSPDDSVDRQADTIHGNRPLRGQEARQISWRRDLQLERRAHRAPRHDRPHDVDVAEHHVAAQRIADLEGPFQVDPVARLERSQRRQRQRLRAQVGGECPAARSTMVGQRRRHRDAAPIGIASTSTS